MTGEVTVEFESTVLHVQRRQFSLAVGSSLYGGS